MRSVRGERRQWAHVCLRNTRGSWELGGGAVAHQLQLGETRDAEAIPVDLRVDRERQVAALRRKMLGRGAYTLSRSKSKGLRAWAGWTSFHLM